MDKQIKELLDKGKLKDLHYNKGERHDWTSGTGSIGLDMFMDGGNRPGIFNLSQGKPALQLI